MKRSPLFAATLYLYVFVCFLLNAVATPLWAAPIVKILKPQPGDTVSGTVAIEVEYQSRTQHPIVRIEIYIDDAAGQPWVNSTPRLSGRQSFAWDTSSYPDGAHSIRAEAFDSAGYKGTAKVAVSVARPRAKPIDRTPPRVVFYQPVDGAEVSGQIEAAVDVQDENGVYSVLFWVDNRLREAIVETRERKVNSSPYRTRIDTRKLSDGPHRIEVAAFDPSENKGTAEITVIVNNSKPEPAPAVPSGERVPVAPPTAVQAAGSLELATSTGHRTRKMDSYVRPAFPGETRSPTAVTEAVTTPRRELGSGAAVVRSLRPGEPVALALATKTKEGAALPAERLPTPQVKALGAPRAPAARPPVPVVSRPGVDLNSRIDVGLGSRALELQETARARRELGPILSPGSEQALLVASLPEPGASRAAEAPLRGLTTSKRAAHRGDVHALVAPTSLPRPQAAGMLETGLGLRTTEPKFTPRPRVGAALPAKTVAAQPVLTAKAQAMEWAPVRLGARDTQPTFVPEPRLGRDAGTIWAARQVGEPVAPIERAVLTTASDTVTPPIAVLLSTDAVRAGRTASAQMVAMLPDGPKPLDELLASRDTQPGAKGQARVTEPLQTVHPLNVPAMHVLYDGEELVLRTPALIRHGIGIGPLREIFEKTDGILYWYPKEKRVRAVNKTVELKLQIGEPTVQVNDQDVLLELAPFIKRGRTMVPVSFLAETLNVSVKFDPKHKRILITSNDL